MKPFLNWAGGKRWLVSNHGRLFVHPGRRFIEPFLGSGAVYFHLEPDTAVLSDTNAQLIEAYGAVRDRPDLVLRALRRHRQEHCETYYYQLRAVKPRTPATRAARLIYLNRTCFNGLYRVNLSGEFNVPKGSKKAVILPGDDFLGWAGLLQKTTLLAQDFQQTLDKVGADDIVYVDPPYTVNHNVNNFLKYNEHIFSWADQVRLSICLHRATQKGARIIISNADHPSIRGLYSSPRWTYITVSRHSRLAASADYRKPTTEAVIANCLTPDGEPCEPRVCLQCTTGTTVSRRSPGRAAPTAYSGQSVHAFRLKPSSDSGRNRPAVPGQTVQSPGL